MNRESARAALLGLALGDALGTTLEFTPASNPFAPTVTTLVGGGPFRLPAGGWTDDTSMALCLGQSLVACQGFDARDQMARYLRWKEQGENSVKGYCFDIGGTVAGALRRFQETHDPMAGSTDAYSAGNGSLMRLVPVVLAAADEAEAIAWAAAQSRTTHGAAEAVDACRFFARLLWKALHGATKDALLDPALGADLHLAPKIAAIAAGSYQHRMPPQIRGTGYVVDALEAALWAWFHSTDFPSGAILAVNLGQDADTTGAIYGQIAGAFYGLDGLPAAWLATLLWREQITALADHLVDRGENARMATSVDAVATPLTWYHPHPEVWVAEIDGYVVDAWREQDGWQVEITDSRGDRLAFVRNLPKAKIDMWVLHTLATVPPHEAPMHQYTLPWGVAETPRPTARPWNYPLVESQIQAGAYPGHPDPDQAHMRITALLDRGITVFVDLTCAGELQPYESLLHTLARERGIAVTWKRFPIADLGTPTPAVLRAALAFLRRMTNQGRHCYLHCRGGVGRTVTVGCCYLMQTQGCSAAQAIAHVRLARHGQYNDYMMTPQTLGQERFIRAFTPIRLP